MKKALLALSALAVIAIVAVGCGDSDHSNMDMSGGATTTMAADDLPDGVTQADVTFAQSMIPHHRQAVDMAEQVIARGSDAEVKALAEQIEAAQSPEIQQMSGWLEDWNQSVPSETGSMDNMSMSGMMSDSEMEQLGQSEGTALDRMFLQMMIKHHEGAITMAKAETADGTNADAKELAGLIATAQAEEIATMNDLLNRLPE